MQRVLCSEHTAPATYGVHCRYTPPLTEEELTYLVKKREAVRLAKDAADELAKKEKKR